MRKESVFPRACLFISVFVYCSSALSQRANVLPDVLAAAVPLYPPLARAAQVQGTVVVKVVVEGGKVQSTKVVSGHPMLSDAAKSNLATWKLFPLPAQTFAVTYHYELNDRCKEKPSVTADFPTEVTVCSKTTPPFY